MNDDDIVSLKQLSRDSTEFILKSIQNINDNEPANAAFNLGYLLARIREVLNLLNINTDEGSND